MWAQVILTPAESKKFIAKAVARLDVVKQAVDQGTVVIHPSSSTYFVVEEITGKEPDTDLWVLGCVVPKGLCRSAGRKGRTPTLDHHRSLKEMMNNFPFKWVIKNRQLTSGIPLKKILEEIGPEDVYIKGCNALDIEGNAGVLFGHAGGGTIGKVMAAQKKKNFKIILPIGLEKLIPCSISKAAKSTPRTLYKYAMGMTCGLYPVRGRSITEVDAVKLLSGARAVPIASGGLGGAEGAVVLSIEGTDEQVQTCITYIEASKGAKLPHARAMDCPECRSPDCHFPADQKHWGQPRSS
jgi:hypothetical protein